MSAIKPPVEILAPAQLQTLAAEMKAASHEDDDPSLYSKNEQEADDQKTLKGWTPEKKMEQASYGGSRAIIMGRRLFSLLMTKDEHHGHQWHISMVEITGPRSMKEMDQQSRELVLNNFFSKWLPVPNPGKMVEVLHFVGND